MAKITFISLLNREAISLANLCSFLNFRDHKSTTIYFKKYTQNQLKKCYALENYLGEKSDSRRGKLVLNPDAPIKQSEIEQLLSLIERSHPEIVGLTVNEIMLKTAAVITSVIKSRFDGLPVIWGGVSPTIEPERCLNHADIVCRGEGEDALVELLDALDGGKNYSHIGNLWLKENGRIIKNEIRPLIRDLDSIPLVDPGYENKFYIEDETVYQGPELDIFFEGAYETMTARGCPFACTYCVNNQLRSLYGNRGYVRRRSVENVIAELRLAKKKRSLKYINFQDDVLTFNKRWIEEFAPAYKEDIDLPFFCYVHPRFTDEHILKKLMDAGLNRVICGIQTGSEHVANNIYNRQVSNRHILECARRLKSLGIEHHFDVITNNPLETEEDCRNTLELLMSLDKPHIALFDLQVYPGTLIKQLIDLQEYKNLVDPKTYRFYNKLYRLTKWFPQPVVRELSHSSFLKKHPALLDIFSRPSKLLPRNRSAE